jgi:hypothetical protein
MEDDLKIAIDIMGQFIGTRDVRGYTKETLMKSYGFDEELTQELTDKAWNEWVEAYGG